MVSIEQRGRIAILTISNPPVNAVSAELAEALSSTVRLVISDPAVQAIVLTGANGTFIAGADIRMLSSVVLGEISLPDLNTFLFLLEQSPKPVIAAIDGSALGGGLETAMAAHYRIAVAGAVLGQPEVKLGLIPGMGGTQRLPRLAGLDKALEMSVFGESITAHDACTCGLVDQIAEGDLLDSAVQFALAAGKPRPTAAQPCPEASVNFNQWRERASRVRRNELAPLAVIDAIEAAATLPFDKGFAREQQLFRACLTSAQSRSMLHLFFAERTAGKIPGLRTEFRPRPINRAAVLGAGFMGTGISMALANAGIPVRLSDVSETSLQRSAATTRERCPNQALIDIRPGLEDFEHADLIIEAVFESVTVKQEAFTKIARVAGEGTMLATNTSTLDIDEIGSVLKHPDHFIGLHFFSPAHVMRLLEVVRAAHTSDSVIASAMALGKRLGKIAVVARNQFGFIGNRMVLPYLREAHRLLEEGASVEQINSALLNFGMRMGPLAMEDLVGLDVTYEMRQEAVRRGHMEGSPPRIADHLYKSGWLGQKTRVGWSVYDEVRKPSPNPEIADLLGGNHRQIEDSEIVTRCLNALVEEGRHLVAEGVALRASDVDLVYVHGYGFPSWRGGPLYWADQNPC